MRETVAPWLGLQKELDNIAGFLQLALEENDESCASEIQEELDSARSVLDRLELSTLLSGPHDEDDAILEINAGAGGTEACDWVQMLLRMYLRWAEATGRSAEILDSLEGDVAGLKNVTIVVRGQSAYGYLKAERGVHRLVRISPFDAGKRRHTTFASVDVIPDVPDSNEVQIDVEDLKIETFRSSSAGGQHVNKTDSAVRITHIPTGITVTCQNERSQHRNRDMAMRVLKARLIEQERRKNEEKMALLRGEQPSIEWGNQIRSYVFHPYNLVKDHRTGVETSDVVGVMNGEIDLFIQAYLRWSVSERSRHAQEGVPS